MKNPKYILIFLILLIISTAGYAGWDYYNTKKIEQEKIAQEELKQEENQEELTEDQLRYRNEVEPKDWNIKESKYGYRVKYPKDWKSNESGITFEHKEIVKYGVLVYIYKISKQEEDLSLEKFLENNLNNPENFGIFYGTKESIDLIEGLDEVLIVDNGDARGYVVEKDGSIFAIKSNPPKGEGYETIVTEDNETFAEAFEKMYKSLEFID